MNFYSYDKDEIKQSLSMEDVNSFLEDMEGEPKHYGGMIVARTICHGGDTHKLYYYENTQLFRCYTECDDIFDIFELTRKVKSRQEQKVRTEKDGVMPSGDWNLSEAIAFVANYFGIAPKHQESLKDVETLKDWKVLNRYSKSEELSTVMVRDDLKVYDDFILNNLCKIDITPWIKEGISREVLERSRILYDPKNCGIVIPHYNIGGELVGIRERTLITTEELRGKYRPAYINKQLYNHPLSLNLYNLNNSKDNIRKMKRVFVFEGEKSTLLYASYFGIENDISVACCGSALIEYQVKLLLELDVEEIVVCFDKQFKEKNDKEFNHLIKKYNSIHSKYGNYVNLSFLFDKWDMLGYKDSPIDQGKETFLELFKRRIIL